MRAIEETPGRVSGGSEDRQSQTGRAHDQGKVTETSQESQLQIWRTTIGGGKTM